MRSMSGLYGGSMGGIRGPDICYGYRSAPIPGYGDRVPESEESLRDGQRILIRPIRPDDKAELAAGMRRLSPESRYRRFFTPTSELSDRQLRYLTEVDHHDHEALVALEPETGHGIGVARFVREKADPELAEVAVAVADSWQGRGVGTTLLHRLTERARDEGVRRFTAEILAENQPMLELLHDLGGTRIRDLGQGAVHVEVELPEEGIGATLRRTLQAAARGLLRVRHLVEP
jgi:RimJ/RimL family protein N-acetyltransferase